MDIGPVAGIRPVTMVRPSPPGSETNPDLAGVFAVELRNRQDEDSYSPSRQPDRGLEDEDDAEASECAPEDTADGSVDFFA